MPEEGIGKSRSRTKSNIRRALPSLRTLLLSPDAILTIICSEYTPDRGEVAVSAVKWQFAQVCLDDIVVCSHFAAGHIENKKHVVTLVRDAEVALKFQKCGCSKTIYYDHNFRAMRLKIALHSTNAIKELNKPWKDTYLTFFLRLRSVFGWFGTNFAKVWSLFKWYIIERPAVETRVVQKTARTGTEVPG